MSVDQEIVCRPEEYDRRTTTSRIAPRGFVRVSPSLSSGRCSGLILFIRLPRTARHLMEPQPSVTIREHPQTAAGPPSSQISDSRHKRERLVAIIRRQSLLQNRDFLLVSGRSSNFFFDMNRTMYDPEGAALLADLLFDAIK